MDYIKFIKLLLVICSLNLISACAVNRVEPVYNRFDTYSLYKVPVIYGIYINKDNSDTQNFYASFSEFDSERAEYTGGCFGSDDNFVIKPVSKPIFTKKYKNGILQYSIYMVPVGEYVFNTEHLYINIKHNIPVYLGNFFPSSTKSKLFNNKYSLKFLPTDYNMNDAKETLERMGISSTHLEQAKYFETKSEGFFPFLCMP